MAQDKDYTIWHQTITKIQVSLVMSLFVIECTYQAILFFNESAGYADLNSISRQLFHYLALPTVINCIAFVLAQIIMRKNPDNFTLQKYSMIVSSFVICCTVVVTHYDFSVAFCLLALPIMLCVLYEDKRLCEAFTLVAALIMFGTCAARGLFLDGDTKIMAEIPITFGFMTVLMLVSRMCINNIKETRERLNELTIQEEELKYAKILEQKNKELELLSNEVIEAFAKAVDFKDTYTAGHSRRVASYSRMIALRMGFTEEESEDVYYAGLLHDVGKIGIDNQIINKPGKLTDAEYYEIQKHPFMGNEMLKDVSIKEEYAQGAQYHHERYDGTGYPNHAKHEEIPLIGRIIAVADAYDAMTSKRSYRDVLPQDKVRAQILNGAGTQFDPHIAKIMVEMIDEDLSYDMRQIV